MATTATTPATDGPPVRDPRFVAYLPDGPLPPLAEPAEAEAALAQAMAEQGDAAMPALAKAAKLGSPEARFQYAMMLVGGFAGPDGVGAGFDVMLGLARQGHGAAALYLHALSMKSDEPLINSHGPYWLNIARRAGNETALKSYQATLEALRAKGDIPPGSGMGDYFDSAITFSQPLKGSIEGVPLEYKVAAVLFPGWRRWQQALLMQDDKTYDVLTMANDDGQTVKLYFDITAWFGKELLGTPPKAP